MLEKSLITELLKGHVGVQDWLDYQSDEEYLDMVNCELEWEDIEEHKAELLAIKNNWNQNSTLKNRIRDKILDFAFNDGVRC